MNNWWRGGIAALILGAPVLACQVIAGIEDRSTGAVASAVDASMIDAATDAGKDSAPASLPSCPLATLTNEAPPDAGDDDSEDLTLVMAFTLVQFPGTPDSGAPDDAGLDLDGVWTCAEGCAPTRGTCHNATLAIAAPTAPSVCDNGSGVDNAASVLIDYGGGLDTFVTEPSVNAGIQNGINNVLIQLQHYNNNSDDPSVDIAFFNSPTASLPDGGPLAPAVPKRDGTDYWTYTTNSVLDLDAAVPTDHPSFVSSGAYVQDHTLYAKLDTLDLVLGTVPVHLTGVKLKADLVSNMAVRAGTYNLQNGQLAARWPTANILAQAGPSLLTNCQTSMSVEYSTLKALLCSHADLSADPTKDGNGTTPESSDAPCNAVSLQMLFQAVAASFSVPHDPVPPDMTCPGFNDDCPQ